MPSKNDQFSSGKGYLLKVASELVKERNYNTHPLQLASQFIIAIIKV